MLLFQYQIKLRNLAKTFLLSENIILKNRHRKFAIPIEVYKNEHAMLLFCLICDHIIAISLVWLRGWRGSFFPYLSPVWTPVRVPLDRSLVCGLGFRSLLDCVPGPFSITGFFLQHLNWVIGYFVFPIQFGKTDSAADLRRPRRRCRPWRSRTRCRRCRRPPGRTAAAVPARDPPRRTHP